MLTLSAFVVGASPEMNGHLTASLEQHACVKVVATAWDESDAVRWLTQPRNDAELVIVDLFLRAGSGLGVLRHARCLQHRRHLIVLSNFTGPDLRQTCSALGASRVFDRTREIGALLTYCRMLAAGITLH